MFEWFSDLSPALRYGVSFLLIGISTVLYFSGVFWPWGWAAGLVLLCASVFVD